MGRPIRMENGLRSLAGMFTFLAKYTNWLHTRWPAGLIEKGPKINDDGTTRVPGVRVVGDLTGVPLLKFSADGGARAVRAISQEGEFERGKVGLDRDLVIIGAGVSGISAAIEAKKMGLNFVVYEASRAFSTIHNFPRRKPIYAYPSDMEPAGAFSFKSSVKEDLLEELAEARTRYGIETVEGRAEKISKSPNGLEVHLASGERVSAQRVIVAIG